MDCLDNSFFNFVFKDKKVDYYKIENIYTMD